MLNELDEKCIEFDFLITRYKRDQRVNENFVKKTVKFLEKSNEQLKEANKKLRDTNEELKKSNEELERFAYIASHDLKTPLHNIVKFTGLLERRLISNTDKGVQDCLSFIKDGGKRMNNLIVDVLEYLSLIHI